MSVKKVVGKFADSLTNLVTSIKNTRNPLNNNYVVAANISNAELREIYKTGLGNKIVRIKSGYALKNDMLFDSSEDSEFYNSIRYKIRQATKFMVGFGRGIILINERGADLSTPMVRVPQNYKLDVFSGDMVTALSVNIDLSSPRYMQPDMYVVRGVEFHPSRVVDFVYERPPEVDLPLYQYGGISEFELIYNQIVNDGIVERASATILEKASNFFYKVTGFKEVLASGRESDMLNFYKTTEDARSIFGAGLIDSEDDIVVLNQSLTDLDKVDQITLRRLAMVTGIPLAILVGENVKGLNSTGETEKQVFNEMIEAFQGDYLLQPINDLLSKLGKDKTDFLENQNQTPVEKLDYERKAIDNALLLSQMGEDYGKYLNDRGIVEKDDFSAFFTDEEYDSCQ